ncbi:MAG: hypothetical protein K5786_04400 [Treponema sp.]|nr:hypothetical protein [Treponema sp.]
MLVIIPHPDDALKISKYQKILRDQLAKFNLIYYKKPPLWFPLPEELPQIEEKLKEIKISSVIMEEPFFKDGKIVSTITMQVNNQLIKNEFALLYPLNSKESLPASLSDPTAPLTQALSQNKKILNFPKEFRIFRIGIAERLSETSAAVSDSVWRKL